MFVALPLGALADKRAQHDANGAEHRDDAEHQVRKRPTKTDRVGLAAPWAAAGAERHGLPTRPAVEFLHGRSLVQGVRKRENFR